MTPTQSSHWFLSQTQAVDVIPVLVVDDVDAASDLAKVLVDAGLPLLEVTLRTPNALAVIEKMASVDGAILVAGTVLNEQQLLDAKSAGALGIVSPGYTDIIGHASTEHHIPLLPGAATASEIMQLSEKGFSMLKFFPAEVNGGVPALKAFSSPLPDVSFCPTGGISTQNWSDYLALPNVSVVGGSWLVTADDIRTRNWKGVTEKANALKRLM